MLVVSLRLVINRISLSSGPLTFLHSPACMRICAVVHKSNWPYRVLRNSLVSTEDFFLLLLLKQAWAIYYVRLSSRPILDTVWKILLYVRSEVFMLLGLFFIFPIIMIYFLLIKFSFLCRTPCIFISLLSTLWVVLISLFLFYSTLLKKNP